MEEEITSNFNLSYSSINVFHSCPTKFMLQKFADLPLKHNNSTATLIGTAMHEAFQTYLVTGKFENAIKVLILKYPHKLKKAKSGKYHILDAYYLLTELKLWYDNSGLELLEINGKPAVEFRIDTKYKIVGGKTLKGFNYIGYIDAIFREKATNSIVICDIKTTSTTNSMEEEIVKYQLSPQTVEYASNILALFGVPDEQISSYIRHVKILYLVARFAGLDNAVVPLWFAKQASDVNNLSTTIEDIVNEIDRKGFAINRYFKSGACSSFGQICPFFPICSGSVPKSEMPAIRSISPQLSDDRANHFNTKTIDKTIYLRKD